MLAVVCRVAKLSAECSVSRAVCAPCITCIEGRRAVWSSMKCVAIRNVKYSVFCCSLILHCVVHAVYYSTVRVYYIREGMIRVMLLVGYMIERTWENM